MPLSLAPHRRHAQAYCLHHPRRSSPETRAARCPQWLHEVKFDGWSMQLHKAGDRVVVFSRNGVDMTNRFTMIRTAWHAHAVKNGAIFRGHPDR
ncbi:MAG: ATP-dependent DNA ligase [Rhodanobacter sp.]